MQFVINRYKPLSGKRSDHQRHKGKSDFPRLADVVVPVAEDWVSALLRNRFTIDLQELLIHLLSLLKDDSDNTTPFSLCPSLVAFSYCTCTPIPSGYAIGTT